jgi:signal transduction histidine kinase
MSTRRRLSQLLLASHVGLVLLFAVLLLATGVGTIRSAVTVQARAEAERSISEARRRLEEWRRELVVGAGLLAEQPTLRFYLQRGQLTKARALVENFHATSAIEYILVLDGKRTIAEIGPRPPVFETGLAFDRQGRAWRVVRRGVRSLPDSVIVVAERLGDRLVALPQSDRISLLLRPLVNDPTSRDRWRLALHSASQTGEPRTLQDVDGSAVARVASVPGDDGKANALLTVRIGPEWLDRRIVEWLASFGLSSALTVLLALAIAVLLAARISRPFAQLAGSAERLGSGDLDTPIPAPVTFLSEPKALAESLEKMRRQVATLTSNERAQREELDAILDGVDEGIVGVNADGTIHYANRQFLDLGGREREDVLGRGVDELLATERRAGGRDATGDLAAPERCVIAGPMRPVLVRRVAASGGRQLLLIREENAIEAGRAMRDRVLANLSHEFQTPLSAQIASIELLRDHLRTTRDAAAIQLADAQYRGTMRLSQLVDNLLDSVRIESGEMRLRRDAVDLSQVVADAVELIQPLTDQREQRVVATLSPGPSIDGDAARLSSVMVNLLANANKFAPDGTTIWVEQEWSAGRAMVWVEDEGPGLPPQHEDHDLFAPFKRSPHEEPSQRGTGLGLAVVRAVVAAHGGEVRIAAPLHRQGARIGVVLPVPAEG